MLNYSKIHSSINHQSVSKRKLAALLNISESTFRSRLDRKNFTPNDIEKIAEFFKKPIAYYFDKDEGPTLSGFSQVSEPGSAYQCPVCVEKQQEIDKLSRKVIEIQEKYSNCLEELLGKKENRAKNSA